jgi:hypothetical protein
MSLATRINDAQVASDLELTSYIGELSASGKSGYASETAGNAVNKIKALKQDRFNYLSQDLTGADNNIISTAYYLTRTKDLTQMASDIDKVAVRQLDAGDINANVITRQNEINEWANSNKLDTLFFLQVLFLCLTFVSALYFMNHSGIISNYLLNLCIVLSVAFAVYVLISRARYTMVRRDSRYWSKLRYPKLHVPNKVAPTCPGDTPADTLPALPQKEVKVCTTRTTTATDTDYYWGSFLGSSSRKS